MANVERKKKTVTKKHLARKQREERQIRIVVITAIVIGAAIIGLIGYGLVTQLIIRPNKTVATVGDQEIKVKQFEAQVQYARVQMLNQTYQYFSFYQQFGEMGQSFLQTAQSLASQLDQPVVLGGDVLDQMINDIIVQEEAAARGITVNEAEIDEALQSAFGFFPNGTPTPTVTATVLATPTLSKTQLALVTPTFTPTATDIPTETPTTLSTNTATPVGESDATPEFTPTITLTPTPFTTEVFASDIKDFNKLYSQYNFDVKDLRQVFRIELLREKLKLEVTADLEPLQQEVWARHILVETEETALDVLQKLEDGGDFGELATEYSTDESNKEKGGDLGWFNVDAMVAPFSEVAFALDEGEISSPVETSFGFHIIQSLGQRESQIPVREFDQVRLQAFESWIAEKREARDDIVISEGWEDFVPYKPEIPMQLLMALYQQ